MASRFGMQIVDKQTGDIVAFEPGLQEEKDFVDTCIARSVANTLALGVGVGRTEAHVAEDMRAGIRAGIEEAIYTLKAQVKP